MPDSVANPRIRIYGDVREELGGFTFICTMRFSDGSAEVVSSQSYSTREDALSALQICAGKMLDAVKSGGKKCGFVTEVTSRGKHQPIAEH